MTITIRGKLRNAAGWDVKLLATDLQAKVLKAAVAGRYAPEQLAGVTLSHFHTCAAGARP